MKNLLLKVMAFTILAIALATFAIAAPHTQEIRVGYVPDYGTIKTDFSQESQGYGYEYLTNLVNYMDGNYALKFVKCNSIYEAMDKLDSGEIDIFGPTAAYDDVDYIYTANEFGEFTMMLSTLRTDGAENQDLDGVTIGVPDYYMDDTCLIDFLEAEEIEAQVVSVNSRDLNSTIGLAGIDYVFMSALQSHTGLTVLAGIESYPVYFMASPESQDLLSEMDAGFARLQTAEPYFESQLVLKYSSYNFTNNAYISTANLKLLQKKGTYYVGIRDFHSPLIREDENGQLEGVAFDLMNMIGKKADISFEYVLLGDGVPQSDYDRVDFVIAATDYTDEIGFPTLSNPYLELPFILLEHKESTEMPASEQRLGVANYYRTDHQMVDGTLYGRQVVKYDTVQDLQKAFDAGDIDSLLITGVSLNMIRDDFKTKDYVVTTIEDTLRLCLAFSEKMTTSEMTVFNKLISNVDQGVLESAILSYALIEQPNTFQALIQQQPWILVNMIMVVVLVVVVGYVAAEYRRRTLMTRQLNTDDLTNLSSQQKFISDCKKILTHASKNQYSMISIDIDNFKYINEMYGYDVGSRLLKVVGANIQRNVVSGAVLARCTGDNFIIMADSATASSTFARCQELDVYMQQEIEEALHLACRINFSVGVYEVADPTADLNVMIDYANIARHLGKETTGITCHYFTEQMAQNRILNNEITTAMIPAVENQEFVLYYQPKVDMDGNVMKGAEVLVRWVKDDKVMPPNRFIPLFEKNGFIQTLDYYVLEHTCQFLKKHQDLHLPRLSVNLSGVSMLRPEIVENTLKILDTYQIQPSQLDLEITETAFVENSVVLEHLRQLRSHGFTISMDDFGTGVSSLNRLKNMELDTLKIDREFIIDSLENVRGNQILRNVMELARVLNLETVAEGIETDQQRQFLKDLGCDEGQGYFFACPLPEDEFLSYCNQHLIQNP